MTALARNPQVRSNFIFAVTIAVYSGLVSLIAWSLIPRLGIVADPA